MIASIVHRILSLSVWRATLRRGRVAVLLLFLFSAQAFAGPNRAILIGINDYGGSRLDYCVADAKALGEQLVRGGEFQPDDVVVMTDDAPDRPNQPTSANISDRLENLAQLGEMDTLLVFFAGHGVVGQDGGGYLLSLEGTVKRSIRLDDVKKWMNECHAKTRILILDCCHAGKGMRDLRILPTSKAASEGIIVMASCGDAQGAYDDPARGHGVFTACLIEGLKGAAATDPDRRVTVEALFKYTEKSVKTWVYNRFNKVQTPVMLPENGGAGISLGCAPKALPPPAVLPAVAPPPSVPPAPPAVAQESPATAGKRPDPVKVRRANEMLDKLEGMAR